jgi:phosphofructokinase-like protein
MRIGVITGGGDCPGLNATLRALVRRGTGQLGIDFVGFRDAWRGVVEGDQMSLDVAAVRGLLPRGGTVLGTSRYSPFLAEDGVERVRRRVEELGLDGIVVIGGEGSMAAAQRMTDEIGLQVVGVPKTIDNDVALTDRTFGFDTAVHVASEALDRLHTTAESHHRAHVVEVMGRSAGWIALYAGISGGANAILIPEIPLDRAAMDQLLGWVESRFASSFSPIVVVAEGVRPEDGVLRTMGPEVLDELGRPRYGGVGAAVAAELESHTGYEVRTTALGYVQRGGTPTAYDRVLATRFGLAAATAVHDGDWGTMVALSGTDVVRVPLAEVAGKTRTVPRHLYDEACAFFG